MRRNMHSGRGSMNRGPGGGGRGLGPRGQAGRDAGASTASGPLMTEHLKLHDLDLELALLKRKREIIEQQQNMLIGASPSQRFSRPSPFGRNEPFNQQYNEPQRFDRTSNFSHLYSSDSHFDRPHGNKRQAEPWQNSSPAKRFSAPQRTPKPNRQSGPRSESSDFLSSNRSQNNTNRAPAQRQSFPKEPAPLMGYGFRPKPGQTLRSKNFKLNKVNKPKPVPPPNKLNNLPVADRRNYVKQASDLVKSQDQNQYVLLADKPASKQLLGRLELALGSILKELKSEYSETEPHATCFKSFNCQRIIKQVIRERIKGAMLGKFVGTAPQIIQSYRTKYPKETDIEILHLALEASESASSGDLVIKPIESENPETYFKVNYTKLLSVKLDEMFAKLKEVYENDPANQEKAKEMETSTTEDGNTEATDAKDTTDDSIKESTDLNGTGNTEKENAEVVEEESKPEEEKKEDTTTDGNNKEETTTEPKPEETTTEPKPEETTTEPKPEETKGDEYNPEEPTDEAADATTVEESKAEENKETPTKIDTKAEHYHILIDDLLKRKLPVILPKYKDHILRILNVDMAYKTTKAAVVMRANQKAEKISEKYKKRSDERMFVQTNNAKEKKVNAVQEKPAPRPLQHFVKIIGKPSLPKRPVMRSFLDSFNPASIKKHRGIHNLLFVGFLEKSDYDNILAANKTVIGNCTVEIKVSERFKGNKDLDKSNVSLDDSDVQMIEDTNQPIVIEDSIKIDTDLDGQITDLLSSIREEEEKALENTEENPEEIENTGEKLEKNENTGEKPEENENIGKKPEENENAEEDTEETEEEAQNGVETADEPNATEETEEKPDEGNANGENKDVEELKNDAKQTGKGTPTRASTRLANSTPSTIRTRRASKLGQN